ncbi:MAG: reverse transcriptase/maturase family protein [Sulfuricurvum sp.]
MKNLLLAAKKATKGKKSRHGAARFWFHREAELFKIQRELQCQTYTFGIYREFEICDKGIKRKISAAPFRDRVVHHAMMNVLEPIFEKSFIHDTYANRKGKGVFAALKRAKFFSRQYIHILKLDIRKYFPSIDHEILKSMVAKKIPCPKTLQLINDVIDSSNPQEKVEHTFYGDDLFTRYERRIGLPLGNLTSQYFGNLYLGGLDHYVKEILRVKGYIRYVDDIIIFGKSVAFLEEIYQKINDFLSKLRLKLHPLKIKFLETKNGFEFLGHKVYPTHFRVTSKNIRRIRLNLHHAVQSYHYGHTSLQEAKNKLFSSIGFLSVGSNFYITNELLARSVFIKPSVEAILQPRRQLEQ